MLKTNLKKTNKTGTEEKRFNSFAGRIENLTDIPVGVSEGRKKGLTLLLDAETFDMEKGFVSNSISGFRLALADPRDVPFIYDHSYYIAPG